MPSAHADQQSAEREQGVWGSEHWAEIHRARVETGDVAGGFRREEGGGIMNFILFPLTSTFPFKEKDNGRWDLCLYKEGKVTRDGPEPQLLPVSTPRLFSFL